MFWFYFICLFYQSSWLYILSTYLPTYLPTYLFMSLPENQVLIHLFWLHLCVVPKFVVIHTLYLPTYLPTYLLIHVTATEPSPNPLCISTQFNPSGKELIQTTNLWLFDGPFPIECVRSGFIMDFLWKLVDFNGWEWCMLES
jgi:hypothetical protein